MARGRVTFTYNDYKHLPEESRYEVIEGELLMVPAPGRNHQAVVRNLLFEWVSHLKEEGGGKVYGAPFDVVLSPENVVQPDLLFISSERGEIMTTANVQGAPDLVIEVLSPGTAVRDTSRKRTLYGKYDERNAITDFRLTLTCTV